jgi:TrmH family RNA methyltransferase
MGAIYSERIIRMDIDSVAELIHSRGMKLYGAALSDRAKDIRELELKNAVVAIGSEGRGLSPQLLGLCDGELIIPMAPGSESLNAAVAASIVLWEMAR